MGLDLEIVLGIVVLTVLGVLLTGPGMWSEKWGWSALRRSKRARATHLDAAAKPGEHGDGRARAPTDARR
jgi:hypothetical protein